MSYSCVSEYFKCWRHLFSCLSIIVVLKTFRALQMSLFM